MEEKNVLDSVRQFIFAAGDVKKGFCSVGCFLSGLVIYIGKLNEKQVETLRNYIKGEEPLEVARIIDKAIGLVTETKGSF